MSGVNDKGEPCPYWTDGDCSNVLERSADLKDHVQIVHLMSKEREELRILDKECDLNRYRAETDTLTNVGSGGRGGCTSCCSW